MKVNTKQYLTKILLFILLVRSEPSRCFQAEFCTSTDVLEDLLATEIKLLSELQAYVDDVDQHVAALYSELNAIKSEHLTAAENIDAYLNNPVNAFRLIKRLHIDWPAYEDVIAREPSQKSYLERNVQQKESLRFPSLDDFLGSAIALARLQETYRLGAAELAKGTLNGSDGTPMSWQDCFVLGQYLYKLGDYNHTNSWLKQSTEILRKSDYGTHSESLNFIEDVIEYHREMGDYESALSLIRHVLNNEPQRTHLLEQKLLLENWLTDGVKAGPLHESRRSPKDYHQSAEFKLYEKVCRGEIRRSAAQQRTLRCRYHTNDVGFRLLQPFKLEELNLDPYILKFHNVLSDVDISTVKSLARPKMKRSLVHASDGSGDVKMSYRTSQSAGFEVAEHPVFEKMFSNIGDFSGLSMAYAEDLQVANYGIGGHYEPHLDSFLEGFDFVDEASGNRIATAMYYLSDVTDGGGTAFPFLPLLVKPERGSALFWFNLHSSGDTDFRTKHAACPVLTGSKWISNIWIRFGNQHHARPCQLHRDNEISKPFENFD